MIESVFNDPDMLLSLIHSFFALTLLNDLKIGIQDLFHVFLNNFEMAIFHLFFKFDLYQSLNRLPI